MKMIGFLAALALASAAPATAMNSGRALSPANSVSAASATVMPMKPTQCVRRVDAYGNIHMMCRNVNEARAAWAARRASYRGNYVVYYQNGKTMKEWERYMKHEQKEQKEQWKRMKHDGHDNR